MKIEFMGLLREKYEEPSSSFKNGPRYFGKDSKKTYFKVIWQSRAEISAGDGEKGTDFPFLRNENGIRGLNTRKVWRTKFQF